MGWHLDHEKHRGGAGKQPWGCKQWGIVCGCLRGASWHHLGGEQSSRGGGESGEGGEEILCPKIEVELMELWWVLGETDFCPSSTG